VIVVYNSSGVPVTGFVDTGTDGASAVDTDSAGNILVAGPVGVDFGLSRFSSAGSIDGSFGNSGTVTTTIGAVAVPTAVAVQSDDKVVVFGVGNTADDFALARYGQTVVAPPVASAGVDQFINEGQFANFSAAGSTGSKLTYAWDLDNDGQFDDGVGVTASRSFGDNGNFTVRVQVTDDQNQSDIAALVVHVANVNPAPSVGGPTSGVRQQSLSFTGSFIDPGFLDTHQVSWNFGDGNTIALHPSTDPGALVPTHVYTSSGTFLVTFGVRDDDNATVFTQSYSVTIAATGIVAGNLLVGGTNANDVVTVRDNVNGIFKVFVGGVVVGQFTNASVGKIILYGGDGADELTIEHDITKDSEIYGGNGDDILKGGGGNDVMFGGAGNDKLKARDANDICVGGDGADTIAGGDGRDILIGGLGADKIAGQDDSDILVAGNTAHDGNMAALLAIRAEWTSGDPNAVTHIRSGAGGLNGSVRLASGVTVFDDAAKDTLAGGTGQDWFIATLSGTGVIDKVTGLNSIDFADDLSFILS
jgi:Ca2+-binding RTX toxin-like protein